MVQFRQSEIGVILAASALRDNVPKEGTLKERLLHAMREVRKPNGAAFMCNGDDQQFRGAVGAVLLTCSDVERTKIEAELRVLRSLSAAVAGVPVDLGVTLGALPNGEPLGLLGLWYESEKPV